MKSRKKKVLHTYKVLIPYYFEFYISAYNKKNAIKRAKRRSDPSVIDGASDRLIEADIYE